MADWVERHKSHLALALLALILVGLALWWERRPSGHQLTISNPSARSTTAREITIDVDGAVVRPGVYRLPEGSRVVDALEAAGGAADDADLTRVNKAAKLRDEQQVRVPHVPALGSEQMLPADGRFGADRLVDLNRASSQQLEALPGVGPVTAQRILEYRERSGPFTRVEQLKEAKLVNTSTFERIKDLVAVR